MFHLSAVSYNVDLNLHGFLSVLPSTPSLSAACTTLGPFAVFLLIAIPSLVFLVVLLIPKHHVCKRTAELPLPSHKIWNVITEFGSYPRWRSTVTKVETNLPGHIPADGFEWFREFTPSGNTKYRVVDRWEGRMLKREIVREKGSHVNGSWFIEIEPIDKESTRITITEELTIYKVSMKLVGFYTGHNRNVDQFLTDLGNKFEQVVVLKDVGMTQQNKPELEKFNEKRNCKKMMR
ncbi:hypothetical protein G9A89_022955 [Geosiphon pyriformis]|nr:hypothetical protein G9A89_022955 [Geosiphon pyriformis]